MSIEMRCGIITTKLGMTQIFSENGKLLPVTLLQAQKNYVLGIKTKTKHNYDSVIVGYGVAKKSRISKPLKGIAEKAGVEYVKFCKEFRVSEQFTLDVGKELTLARFTKGQYIDATATSIGKGFAGVMKRHNFGGLEASHGVSVSHRSHGSTGQRQDPGKVFKGKKMAGHMGNTTVTTLNLKIVDIDQELGIIMILGAVPGSKGGIVYLRDAIKKGIPVFAEK